MNNIVNRRRALGTKLEPQDIVTTYSWVKTVDAGERKSSAQTWFSFRTDAIYSVEATCPNIVGSWKLSFLGGTPTVITGSVSTYSGTKLEATFKFTSTPAGRFTVFINNSTGHTVNVKLIETIPAT